MVIKYEIKFLDFWHMGSGISGGSKLDNFVLKDKNKIPFISGKTIKGLVREAAEILGDENFIKECFGFEETIQAKTYFSNATVKDKESIISHNLAPYLYKKLSFTSINQDGVADDNSLREIEVVVPLTLEGEILNVPDIYTENMIKALKMVKRMGLNRNRGLGRCQIKVIK